ncbi:MAG: superoxide dismutase family protein [Acidobacteriaceae bacterium]
MRMIRWALAISVSAFYFIAFTHYAVSVHAQAASHAAYKRSLVVPIKTSTGQDAGKATFEESKDGKQLTITVKLKNIPSGNHAVHIHQNPVCDAPAFTTAGGHFNPGGKQHGMDNPLGHHAGDMPHNLSVGTYETGEITYKVDYLTLEPGAPNSVLGHSIMVHEKPDDMVTDPTGNAGSRIACGVIPATN